MESGDDHLPNNNSFSHTWTDIGTSHVMEKPPHNIRQQSQKKIEAEGNGAEHSKDEAPSPDDVPSHMETADETASAGEASSDSGEDDNTDAQISQDPSQPKRSAMESNDMSHPINNSFSHAWTGIGISHVMENPPPDIPQTAGNGTGHLKDEAPSPDDMPSHMETADETASAGEASLDSGDDDNTDTQTSQDPSRPKNRSKRKPSKTQIKHIAPSGNQNCVNSKYGIQNMEDLFNDVTQGIYRGSQSQPQQITVPGSQAHSSTNKNVVSDQSPSPTKRTRRLSQASAASASSGKSGSSKPPPSYPCGICGKIFRVPSRYDSHMLGHSKGKPFCCNTCGKMFASQEKLDHHMPVHSTDRKASFTCEMCGKVSRKFFQNAIMT